MNQFKIKTDRLNPGLSEVVMELSAVVDTSFKRHVFPHLFADGKTTGVRTPLANGRARYRLLVYDASLVHALKSALYYGIHIDQGQLN
ncbi:hypothetical protein [Fibrella forsythiae]|uniref:Uncharacterized protein n=1 Tax=Fibrella forsythiae TaxID=2817061 RepID=A0ABS3JBE3_9BACT|nr:hypothetical protein [Fibrella forsythiae]MBO0947318.1 hypothetical protein [Fibrella forsythiae]